MGETGKKWFFVMMVLLWTGNTFCQAQVGHIQIKCEPGVQVFLDGELKGITNADVGGLILQDVPRGNHVLKFAKPNYTLQEAHINLKSSQILVHTVQAFIPKVQIESKGDEGASKVEAKVGTIVIQSLPVECEINFPTAGLLRYGKDKAEVTVRGVPIGNHKGEFLGMGKKLPYTIEVQSGQTNELMVNFIAGTVENLAAQRKAERRKVWNDKIKEVEEALLRSDRLAVAEAIKAAAAIDDSSPEFLHVWEKAKAKWPPPSHLSKEKIDLDGGVVLEMIYLQNGTFQMGSNDGDGDEVPVHTVSLDGFWIGKFEVTQEQYKAVMDLNPSYFKEVKNPVDTVSWNEAVDFCQKLSFKTGRSFRLPTEAEWEYACRAGSPKLYSFGDSTNELVNYAWYRDNSGGKMHPVGQKQPNAWGLYDMHGNAWEWCADWKGDYFRDKQRNPVGPSTGTARIPRGGSWRNSSHDCRSANRDHVGGDHRNTNLSFRVLAESELGH